MEPRKIIEPGVLEAIMARAQACETRKEPVRLMSMRVRKSGAG